MKLIPLTQGFVTFVDDEDFDYLSQFNWFYVNGYAGRRFWDHGKKGLLYMHRVILNSPKGMDTDHINRYGLDNRRSNLRICTRSQNLANRSLHRNNSSGRRGVFWSKQDSKWMARVKFNKRSYFVGSFDNIDDAARAYEVKAQELFGDFYQRSSL